MAEPCNTFKFYFNVSHTQISYPMPYISHVNCLWGIRSPFLNVSLPSITKLPPSGALFWGTPLICLCGSSLGTRFRLHLPEIFFYPVVGLYQGPLWMIRAESLARGSLLLNWREGWTVGFSMAFWGQVDLFPKDPQGWMDRLPKRHWGTMHRFLEDLCTEGQTLGGLLGQSTVTFWGPQFYLGFSWASIHSWFL